MVSEFEKEDSFPVDLIPLMIDRYLTPHSTAPVDRGTVERLLVEVWENIPDGHRHTAVVRLMIGMGYLPVWPHLDEWGDAAMARGDVLDPGNLGEILNRLQLA